MLAAGAREAEEAGAPPPFHVRPALDRRDARALRSSPPSRPYRRRLRSAAERRARAGGRIGSRRRAAARADAIPVGGIPRLRDATGRRAARPTSIRRARALIDTPSATPAAALVIVAIGDRPFDPDGFWPADVVDVDDDCRSRADRRRLRRAACSMPAFSIGCSWRLSRSRRRKRPSSAGVTAPRCRRWSCRATNTRSPIAIAKTSSKASRAASRPTAAAA